MSIDTPIKVHRLAQIGPIDSEAVRKKLKTTNLLDAKQYFPYKVSLSNMNCTVTEAQVWLLDRRWRSWKQKGLNAEYYYDSWHILYFANKENMMEFVLTFSK